MKYQWETEDVITGRSYSVNKKIFYIINVVQKEGTQAYGVQESSGDKLNYVAVIGSVDDMTAFLTGQNEKPLSN